MAKKFFEVFPTLKLDAKMKDLFEQVMVEKVSATKRRDLIRVTIVSDYLITKEIIFKVEKEIKKQFFSTYDVTVKLYEKFHLSGQYNPEKLMEAYRDSILLELRDYSPIEYNLFKGADIEFCGEKEMILTIEDSVPAHSKADEVSRILEKILNERCGFSIDCRIVYKEKETDIRREEDERKIARQIAEITERAFGDHKDVPAPERNEENDRLLADAALLESVPPLEEAKAEPAGGGVTKLKKGNVSIFPGTEKKGFRKGEFQRGGRGDFKRAVKSSDNPDVIYGKDFEEEAMPIEDIIGEMGEVVIKGKIINYDSREIKNERTILIFDVTDFTDTMTIKLFARNEQVEELTVGIKKGAFVKLKGLTTIDKFDNELTIGSLVGVKKIPDVTSSRSDTSARKRVELHCHIIFFP